MITEQVWLVSADGTWIPMFLVHRRDLTTDNGPHPTLLCGYGGFRISIEPTFKPARDAFIAAGGVRAVPTLRGGGEYGTEWHDAGRLANEQNVSTSRSAAEYLVAQGWTTAEQFATMVVTSDHDDRVVPAHSYKFAARLQAANPEGMVLLRVELDSGHGAGRARSAVIDESTDLLAFHWDASCSSTRSPCHWRSAKPRWSDLSRRCRRS